MDNFLTLWTDYAFYHEHDRILFIDVLLNNLEQLYWSDHTGSENHAKFHIKS